MPNRLVFHRGIFSSQLQLSAGRTFASPFLPARFIVSRGAWASGAEAETIRTYVRTYVRRADYKYRARALAIRLYFGRGQSNT